MTGTRSGSTSAGRRSPSWRAAAARRRGDVDDGHGGAYLEQGVGAPRQDRPVRPHQESRSSRARATSSVFDPALPTGETANVAAGSRTASSPPGEPVPNDNDGVDEGHWLLSYMFPQTQGHR